jgi:hypothetical protein
MVCVEESMWCLLVFFPIYGEDGRGTWLQCKGKLNLENTMHRQHTTLIEGNAGNLIFQGYIVKGNNLVV